VHAAPRSTARLEALQAALLSCKGAQAAASLAKARKPPRLLQRRASRVSCKGAQAASLVQRSASRVSCKGAQVASLAKARKPCEAAGAIGLKPVELNPAPPQGAPHIQILNGEYTGMQVWQNLRKGFKIIY
jgi:hypothetical protein